MGVGKLKFSFCVKDNQHSKAADHGMRDAS